MPPLGDLIRLFVIFYLVAIVFGVISDVTHFGRTIREVTESTRRVLVRALFLTVVTLTTFFVYRWLGVEAVVAKSR